MEDGYLRVYWHADGIMPAEEVEKCLRAFAGKNSGIILLPGYEFLASQEAAWKNFGIAGPTTNPSNENP